MRKSLGLLLSGAVLSWMVGSTPAMAGPGGTVIRPYKTAKASITRTEKYSWDIETKTKPGQVPYVLGEGESAEAQFTITVTRSGPEIKTTYSPVSGKVCINNVGDAPTVNLEVKDRLEAFIGGTWVAIMPWFNIDTLGEIPAKTEVCFPYEIPLDKINPEIPLRNHAKASVDNFEGHEGEQYTIDFFADVELTSSVVVIDDKAQLTDLISCPEGFSCTFDDITQTLEGSKVIYLTVTIKNESVECGKTFTIVNTAKIDPMDTHESETSSASITVYTGSCPEENKGCSYTIGYWQSPNGSALASTLVPVSMNLGTQAYTAAQLQQILSQPVTGNALVSLARQLIAAKLNILSGASSASIAATIAAADLEIGSLIVPPIGTDVVVPASPQGQTMVALAATLDQFNNGLLGVPHCEDRSSRAGGSQPQPGRPRR